MNAAFQTDSTVEVGVSPSPDSLPSITWGVRHDQVVCAAAVLLLGSVALADAPRGVSTRAARDEVAEKVQRLRQETEPEKRLALVREIGRIPDPRVSVALMELVLELTPKGDSPLLMEAAYFFVRHHIPPHEAPPTKFPRSAAIWWEQHEAEVRRRAESCGR